MKGGEGLSKKEDNLRSLGELSPEERKAIQRKGGVNSGKVRRKKADLKKAMEIILTNEVNSKQQAQLLASAGLDTTNDALLLWSIFQKAVNGNQRAVENILKIVGTKDKYDIDEQKARIKNLKAQQQKDSSETKIEQFMFDLGEAVDEY